MKLETDSFGAFQSFSKYRIVTEHVNTGTSELITIHYKGYDTLKQITIYHIRYDTLEQITIYNTLN